MGSSAQHETIEATDLAVTLTSGETLEWTLLPDDDLRLGEELIELTVRGEEITIRPSAVAMISRKRRSLTVMRQPDRMA